jgi:peptidoglycan/xylan/chitin deacetylase (PgdA/CDA1 family)
MESCRNGIEPVAFRSVIHKLGRPLKSLLRHALHILCLPFPPTAPRVLIYHSVDDNESPISITPELFARQMDYLVEKGYVTWPASRFVEALRARTKLPRKLVIITFDDGYVNNLTHALPIMEQRGLCATLFMVTRNAGDVPCWAERDLSRIRSMIHSVFSGSQNEKNKIEESVLSTLKERIATWDELKPAPGRGLEIMSHTRTHPYMDQVNDERLADELQGSRADLAEQGFDGCSVIAWPYGKYDDRAIEAARQAGYHGTFVGDYEWKLRKHPDPMRIHRVGVDSARGVFGLAYVLGRGYDLAAWLKRFGGAPKPS